MFCSGCWHDDRATSPNGGRRDILVDRAGEKKLPEKRLKKVRQNEMKENKEQIKSLYGIRALACLCVVCYHYWCVFVSDAGLGREMEPWYPASKYFFEYSKNAVEMFFLISGFLIAYHYRDRILTMSFPSYFKRHFGKLIGASIVVNLWAWGNAGLMTVGGFESAQRPVTALRMILSVLMMNTGWFTSVRETGLPVCSTMWYIDILFLCYLLYFAIGKIGRNRIVYLCICAGMVLVGKICLDATPNLPFLWALNGRGYAPFFLGVLLYEFQERASEKVRRIVTWLWSGFVAVFFVFHMIVGFERVFGVFGTMNYVRYFEFVAAPGILLAALNLPLVRNGFSWEPLCMLGSLSAEIYYVHNNVFQDYWMLNRATGERINLLAPPAFLLMVVSVIPWGVLYKYLRTRFYGMLPGPEKSR